MGWSTARAKPPGVDAMALAATEFTASLSDEQRAHAVFAFDDARRTDWHYVPRSRPGVRLDELNPDQQLRAHKLLSETLSARGIAMVGSVTNLEAVLRAVEGRPVGDAYRDPGAYHVCVFGVPGVEPWMWRLEGHHLSLNFTATTGGIGVEPTPQFVGANPATERAGPAPGRRTLAAEEDLARALVRSMDDAQRARAILNATAPADVLNRPGRVDRTKPEGIAWSELRESQRAALKALVRHYLDRCRAETADAVWRRVEAAGLERLHFAWAGGTEPGQGHYYRVQGGTFVLEYDNTQGGANHIHTLWRDFDHDFGGDALREHLRRDHAPAPGGR